MPLLICPYIIGVPFESGCDRKGAGQAPEWLWRNAAFLPTRNTHVWVNLHISTNDMQRFGVKNYDAVLNTCMALRDVISKECKEGRKLLILGGDHSIALGSIAGVLEDEPNLAVIWFDAHGDINTESTSPSANAHGMPLAALMGLCASGLNDVANVRLKPQNVFWVGARDLDEGEIDILKQLGIYDHVYAAETIRQRGMSAVMEEIAARMKEQHIERLHLSFDIDGVDPSIVHATGTPVANGLLQSEVDAFIHSLPQLPTLQSLDFVEYNPLMDDDEKRTGKWCVETLKCLVES